jgi:acetyltransferase
MAKLEGVLPRTWSRSNPVDIIGDATGKRYSDALSILLEAPETNAVLVINCPTAIASGVEAASAVIETVKGKRRCVLTNWLGSKSANEARRLFTAARIPTFETPDDAVTGFMHLVRYRRGQNIIMEVPSSTAEFNADVGEARSIVEKAVAADEHWLSQPAIHELLKCYGIRTPRLRLVASAADAGSAARELAGPVALKIASPDVVHKSDVGGVVLNLEGAEIVQKAAKTMAERVQRSLPKARVSGFVVQEMVRKPGAHELIVGMAIDRQFGPFLLFGQGGTAVEVINDKALALPPVNLMLARELMSQTRVYRQLKGYRDRPAAALDDIAAVIVRLSQLVTDLDEVAEIDINPLLADEEGVIALDARVRLVAREPAMRGSRLAILSYPRELERTESIPGFATAVLRPIRPEDAPALADLIGKMAAEDARLRFFASVRSLGPRQLVRMTQIDYDREMAFVLMGNRDGGAAEFAAVVHLAADPDNERAEFAILVRSDLHRRGIGRVLMTRLIEYARARHLTEIFGHVLRENMAMLGLCGTLGFEVETSGEEPEAVRVRLRLT